MTKVTTGNVLSVLSDDDLALAYGVAGVWFAAGHHDYELCAQDVGMAIYKTRDRALEEAANITENYRPSMSFWMSREWGIAKTANEHATKSISQAIRQHSQKGRDK